MPLIPELAFACLSYSYDHYISCMVILVVFEIVLKGVLSQGSARLN